MALAAEDVELTSLIAEREATTFRGHDGVRAWWEAVIAAFEDARPELLHVPGSDDRGVAHFRMAASTSRLVS